jgi:hypothetical protein
MSHSYDVIVDFTKKVCQERDLAEWFFTQTNLSMVTSQPSGGGALRWTVRMALEKPSGQGNYTTPFKVIGHSYTSPFEAIRIAQVNMEQGTGRDI